MNTATRQAALEHALREAPREACGLVVILRGEERYWPCRNMADGQDDFIMDPRDYAEAEDHGDIVAVVHSHPNASSLPSQADRVACEASGLPWHIVSTPDGIWSSLAPNGYKAPLIGREFVHGVLDCWSCVRDWFQQERNITLPDFERRNEWWKKGENLYLDNSEKTGFVRLPEDATMEPGDVILMRIRSVVPNHAAVYLGDSVILHHLQGHLSCRDIYGGIWRKYTAGVFRYAGGA